jgi:thioredoxin 1
MSNLNVLTESNFDAEVASGVTLVDFWAEWCGPCKLIMPTMEELAGEYEGKAKIGKANVDEAPALAQKYSVSSIPTILILKDGEEIKRFVGVTKKGELAGALDEALS